GVQLDGRAGRRRGPERAIGRQDGPGGRPTPDRVSAEELRSAGLCVRRGDNDIRSGVAGVTARIRTRRLRVLSYGCPNLIAGARLDRYPSAAERALVGENPVDEHNHALAALRYLVSRIDARYLAQLRKRAPSAEGKIEAETIEDVNRRLLEAQEQ